MSKRKKWYILQTLWIFMLVMINYEINNDNNDEIIMNILSSIDNEWTKPKFMNFNEIEYFLKGENKMK